MERKPRTENVEGSSWGTADDDWNQPKENVPVFNLFRWRDPRVEALKDEFIGMDAYLCWSKAERKLYAKIKAERVAARFKKEANYDELSDALANLKLMSNNSGVDKADLDSVIRQLEDIKLEKLKREKP